MVFSIFKRDLARILKNPFVTIMIIGACILPSAYAWFCTAANWDPYGSTQHLVVAVANEDEGASLEQVGSINIGSEVEDKLRENDQLGWTFYNSAQEAITSVEAGTSYAALVFPANFSAGFASILTGDFVQPQIDYYLNEKLSASAPEFTDRGAHEVQKQINETFVSTVGSTILSLAKDAGYKVEDDAGASQHALSGDVSEVNRGLSNLIEALGAISPALTHAKESVQGAQQALSDLKAAAPRVNEALGAARLSLDLARKATNQFDTDANQTLTSGSLELSKAASDAERSLAHASSELSLAYGRTSSALRSAQQVNQQMASIIKEIQKEPWAEQVKDLLATLESINRTLGTNISRLTKANEALHTTLLGTEDALTSINDQAQKTADNMQTLAGKLSREVNVPLQGALSSMAEATGTFSTLTATLLPVVEAGEHALSEVEATFDKAQDIAEKTEQALRASKDNMESLAANVNLIESSEIASALKEALNLSPEQLAHFIASPVKLSTQAVYPVKNYGSGVAPFFTAVALWVAGFVFIDLFKMRVRPDGLAPFSSTQAYLGRWLLFMFLGLFPGLIACTGDLVLGIQCEHPVAFYAVGIISCLVFVNIIYALAHAFRFIGKGLAVFFLIIQIPGSSGLYPIQMLPRFYQGLHPWLPFTYTIDAFRQTIGGFYGIHYALDLLVLLLIWVPVGLFIGIVLGRWVSNLNLLLDRMIESTDLFDGEKVDNKLKYRASTLLMSLLKTPEYKASLKQKVAAWRAKYPRLRLAGWIVIAAQFIVTFILMIVLQADVNSRLILLAVLVGGFVVVDVYLIGIVYRNEDLNAKLHLLELPNDKMQEELHAVYSTADFTAGTGALMKGKGIVSESEMTSDAAWHKTDEAERL